MDRQQKDTELFDGIAHNYVKKDVIVSSSIARKFILLEAMRPALAAGNIGTVVEIGCGTGASARYLDGYYEKYYGVDASKNMIELARHTNRSNDRAVFYTPDRDGTPIPDNTADVILSVGVLHHMEHPDEAFASLKRVAKNGCLFIAIEPQRANPLIQALRKLRKLIDSSYSRDQVFFSEKELYGMLARAGLEGIEFEYQGFLTPPFAQMPLSPQFLFKYLSRLAIKADMRLNDRMPGVFRKLSFNIVARGVIKK